MHAAERFGLRLGDRAVHAHLEQLHVAADRVERRAKLVAHHREEGALRAIRLLGDRALALELRRLLDELLLAHLELHRLPLELLVRDLHLAALRVGRGRRFFRDALGVEQRILELAALDRAAAAPRRCIHSPSRSRRTAFASTATSSPLFARSSRKISSARPCRRSSGKKCV